VQKFRRESLGSGYSKKRILSNGPEAAAEGAPGLDKPLATAFQKPWLLDQAEEPPLTHKSLEILQAVAPIALVGEVQPEPGSCLPVKHIEGAGFRVAGHHYKQQHRAWELNPANDFRMVCEI